MSSVSSVCRAYGKRMNNVHVYAIRPHTLNFEQVPNQKWLLRMTQCTAYLERSRRMPYVPLT